MTNTRCRAKNPETCWKHGTNQGYLANDQIIKVLTTKNKYHVPAHERKIVPLKQLDSPGLALAIIDETKQFEGVDSERIRRAILIASELHKTDTRSNRGRYIKTPYIEHPLRNTLRLIRLGVTNESTLIGSIFHDTVEDHPHEISENFAGIKAKDEEEARVNSLNYLTNTFNPRVSEIVAGMSNPIMDKYLPSAERNVIYANHVKEAIEDPDVAVCKISDFIDNAVGLHHNISGGMSDESIRRKARKYLLVCDVLENRLLRNDGAGIPASSKGVQSMVDQLRRGRKSLLELSVYNLLK